METIILGSLVAYLIYKAIGVVCDAKRVEQLKAQRALEKEESLNNMRINGISREYVTKGWECINKYGGEVVGIWLKLTEPKYRNTRSYINDYPPDWYWRKVAVNMRDSFKCCECGAEKNIYLKSRQLGQRVKRKRPLYVDVHHKVPISKGGAHGLDNLVALCRKCHRKAHQRLHDDFRARDKTVTKSNRIQDNPGNVDQREAQMHPHGKTIILPRKKESNGRKIKSWEKTKGYF